MAKLLSNFLHWLIVKFCAGPQCHRVYVCVWLLKYLKLHLVARN